MAATITNDPRYPHLAELADGRPLSEIAVSITLERPSYHGRTEFTLWPGVVDADAIELFGFAKCHVLASAMHDRTGWRFGVLDQLVGGVWKWAHAGVVTPGGLFLDIHGAREIAEVVDRLQADYGPRARISTYASYEDYHAATASDPPVVPWTDLINPLGVELVRYFASHLVAEAESFFTLFRELVAGGER
jgi:hypothetical protein